MRRSNKRSTNAHKIIVIGLSLALSACQAIPYEWKDSVHDSIDDSLRQASKTSSAKSAEVPRDVSDALLPPLPMNGEKSATPSQELRFDINVSRAPARQVYMGLVEGTKYGVVVHPDVRGQVSLNLKDVTVPEAMNVLRDVYGYHYQRDGERFYILSQGMHTRLFKVNYLNLNRKGRSRTQVTSGELTQAGSSSGSSSSGKKSGSSAAGGSKASMEVETSSQADFWKELKLTIETIIGDEQGRKVVLNPQAGIVVVRAMPEELIVVENFLGLTHASVNRQVVLEAKVLEIELKDGFQTGINWSRLSTPGDYTVTGSQIGGGTIFSGSGISEIATNPFTLDPSGAFDPSGGTGTSAFGGVFSLAVQATNFNAFIEALKAQGDVHVLSSPRVSTVNNQKAVIKVGGDEFFVTGVTSTTVTNSLGGSDFVPTVELTPFFSGIALDVTPQIDEHDNVILHIHPAISNVAQSNKSFIIFDQDFNLPLAVSSIQESDNVVRSHSGQVIVIGGLMKEGSTDDEASIPLLGDIPILGNLFKHKRVTRIKKELVILLKPTVINVSQQWDNMTDDSRGRMKKLNRSSW